MRTESIQTGQHQRLFGKIHSPRSNQSGSPEGVFVCIHGLGDHGGHFEDFAALAAEQNFATVTMDLVGHGRSPGRRGHAKSYEGLLVDIAHLRRDVRRCFPESPQTMLGHSMGGNLVVNYVLRRSQLDRTIDGMTDAPPPVSLVLLSPMFLPPQHLTRPQIFAAWLTGYVLSAIRVKKRANLCELTSDSDQAELIASDPKRHGKLSIYLATQLLSQGRWALDHARDIDMPTLLIFGESDSMVDREAIQNAAIRVGNRATLVPWQHGLHDLLHDTDAALVTERILTWQQSIPAAIRSSAATL